MIPKLDEYKKRWELKSDDMIKPGLEAVRKALLKVGNPEKNLKVIHVSGTNGKGSTIAFMENILKEHGFSTGVFSSPAMIDLHDQIRIDGDPISNGQLNQSFKRMQEAELSGLLTDFELLTVAAFITFERLSPDYVLLETGMGGLLDSTNVVTPLVSVITSIALDHIAFLGSSLTEVTKHKAGIIKKGIPAVTGPLEKEAFEVVQTIAKEQGSPLSVYGDETFKKVEQFQMINRKMRGKHQGQNAVVALVALKAAGVQLNERAMEKGVATAQLAYRFEEIAPDVFLDGAHNPAAAKALTETIKKEFPGEKVDFIIGMLKRKEIKKTLAELMPVANSFTFLTFSHPEAATGEELMADCALGEKKIVQAQDLSALFNQRSGYKKVVTGSLYLLATLL